MLLESEPEIVQPDLSRTTDEALVLYKGRYRYVRLPDGYFLEILGDGSARIIQRISDGLFVKLRDYTPEEADLGEPLYYAQG